MPKAGARNTPNPAERPEAFRYHDYRELLKDWLAWLKASQSGFSLRALASRAEISVSNLSMILSGSRKLNHKTFAKLAPALGLQQAERAYFELLMNLGNAETQEARLDAYQRMSRIPEFRKNNPQEAEVFRYLTHWYYVAIREMSALPDFSPNPAWIQKRLRFHVDLGAIDSAVDFLVKNGYIEQLPDGKIRPPAKPLDCMGGVYRIALAQFHREMLALASRSIEKTSSERRNIVSYTLPIGERQIDRLRNILDRAHAEIRALAQEVQDAEAVYHVEMAAFPLTTKEVPHDKTQDDHED